MLNAGGYAQVFASKGLQNSAADQLFTLYQQPALKWPVTGKSAGIGSSGPKVIPALTDDGRKRRSAIWLWSFQALVSFHPCMGLATQ